MSGVSLYPYQLDAVHRMKNGCILCGGVGSGKSRTSLAYYYVQNGGILGTDRYVEMKNPKDLYIITTARKRDTLEWNEELVPFLLSENPEANLYSNKVVIDSWNNIGKYSEVTGAFFIFDEQRVVGKGKWVKSFLKITKSNAWILLSATPGDTWSDYIPVFIANGFYKNRSEFSREHIIYKAFARFPQIDRYVNEGRLIKYRRDILVDMDFERKTVSQHIDWWVLYDIQKYKEAIRTRWNPYKNAPTVNASEQCFVLRRIVNEDESRQLAVLGVMEDHPKVIIFYNFDYERDILLRLSYPPGTVVAEWTGHEHQNVPDGDRWVYLVQYTAGCEGWNCVKTDTMIFYSQTYSYKVAEQAAGRIDRLNTPFRELYYYHLRSRAGIDVAIGRALAAKKNFSEAGFARRLNKGDK